MEGDHVIACDMPWCRLTSSFSDCTLVSTTPRSIPAVACVETLFGWYHAGYFCSTQVWIYVCLDSQKALVGFFTATLLSTPGLLKSRADANFMTVEGRRSLQAATMFEGIVLHLARGRRALLPRARVPCNLNPNLCPVPQWWPEAQGIKQILCGWSSFNLRDQRFAHLLLSIASALDLRFLH